MRLDGAAVFFERDQMRDFVNQRHQKTISVQACIYRNLMASHVRPIIPMSGYAIVDDLEMDVVGHDQIKDGLYGKFRQISR